jgi:Lon protease-like protein
MWREFGLRTALAHMPRHSPGRAVIETLLARGSLTDEDGRRFKMEGLRTALAHIPPDEPGRAVVEDLLARERARAAATSEAEVAETPADEPVAQPAARTDLTQQLERLASLHERGHLTSSEFEAAKRKLLA